MAPFEAIQAATKQAAELLRIEGHAGRIASGYNEDLILMGCNPHEDIGAYHDLLMVVNNGKVVLDRLGW